MHLSMAYMSVTGESLLQGESSQRSHDGHPKPSQAASAPHHVPEQAFPDGDKDSQGECS